MNQKENYNGLKKAVKFIANVISWTILVFLLLIAAFLAYYFIANKVYTAKGKKYEPTVGLYTIVSPSMTPNLNVYDVILDVKVDSPEDIKVGDIITFISTSSISKGLTITHRVVAIVETENGLEYKTQGDNNLTPDTTTVPFKNILGKVLIRIPQLGRIQYFLSSSSGWLIIVVIPAALIILSDIVKIIRLSKTKKKVNKALETEELMQEKEEEEKEQIKNKLKERYSDTLNEKDLNENKHIPDEKIIKEQNSFIEETSYQDGIMPSKEVNVDNGLQNQINQIQEQEQYQQESNEENKDLFKNIVNQNKTEESTPNFNPSEINKKKIKLEFPKLKDEDKKD